MWTHNPLLLQDSRSKQASFLYPPSESTLKKLNKHTKNYCGEGISWTTRKRGRDFGDSSECQDLEQTYFTD